MAKDEEDDLLPDKDAAKGFYAKYEPKEILGSRPWLRAPLVSRCHGRREEGGSNARRGLTGVQRYHPSMHSWLSNGKYSPFTSRRVCTYEKKCSQNSDAAIVGYTRNLPPTKAWPSLMSVVSFTLNTKKYAEFIVITVPGLGFGGISSTVRRCIEKETGKEFAAKIIDLGAAETGDSNHMLEATRQEIQILRQVMGHKFIIELQDVFESDAFIFLVFELCRQGELFDYLTSVVTLSEKKSRYIMSKCHQKNNRAKSFDGPIFNLHSNRRLKKAERETKAKRPKAGRQPPPAAQPAMPRNLSL
ncbi:conserved hypothetical protein [Culex quinquefasciatus]|uniref:Protein kinase domain-containing protein n=1 Tax=Culex quinquefasciatus TaxID=7176 RepID=B0X584_CULQU|nr:conserved hypothetical protein [Culex quinquefasciatus]|eukprot:XP_001864806.1 conserved hypothetical protein [Culex quinquefasciatus]